MAEDINGEISAENKVSEITFQEERKEKGNHPLNLMLQDLVWRGIFGGIKRRGDVDVSNQTKLVWPPLSRMVEFQEMSTYWLLDSGVWVRHRGRVRSRKSIRCFILAPLTSCTSVSPLVVRCSLICTVSHVSMDTILLELKQFDPSTLFDTMLGYCFHKAWFICFPCK